MVRAIVTPEVVATVAEQLLARGEEPSIIAVQKEIGGGSYTTVKRFLDSWKAQPAIEVPPEVEEQAHALAQRVWVAATTLTQQ